MSVHFDKNLCDKPEVVKTSGFHGHNMLVSLAEYFLISDVFDEYENNNVLAARGEVLFTDGTNSGVQVFLLQASAFPFVSTISPTLEVGLDDIKRINAVRGANLLPRDAAEVTIDDFVWALDEIDMSTGLRNLIFCFPAIRDVTVGIGQIKAAMSLWSAINLFDRLFLSDDKEEK